MILDMQTLFSDDQAITTTAASTNLIDLGAPGSVPIGGALNRDVGPGTPIEILIQHVVDSGGTSPTFIATLQNDNDVAFGSATTIATSATMSGALKGDRASIVFVPDSCDERYLRLNYTTGGTTPTHTVTAGIVLGRQTRPV
jgi:hypothetical protein